MINSAVYRVVPEYAPYLMWIDMWDDEVAGEERIGLFWRWRM